MSNLWQSRRARGPYRFMARKRDRRPTIQLAAASTDVALTADSGVNSFKRAEKFGVNWGQTESFFLHSQCSGK